MNNTWGKDRADAMAGVRSRPAGQRGGREDWIALSVVVVLSALVAGLLLRIGFVPSDEGTLGQSSLRVYQGQLPQRDFAEIYTGGLSFYHAAAFHLWGVNLFSLRLAVFTVFLLWVPVVYWVARRFVSPRWAAVVTLTAVSWSYPNYVAAMPSWYNLFLATFAVAALLRFLEAGTRRWLVVAGLFCGASVLVKVVGLYSIAAVLLFLLFVEQERSAVAGGRGGWLYRSVCGVGLAGFVAAVTGLVWPQLRDGEVYQFVLPAAACVGLLVWREARGVAAGSGRRFVRLLNLVVPFVLGIVLVMGVFAARYAAMGSMRALLRGVVGSTSARMTGLAGKAHAPGLGFAVYGAVTMALLVCGMYAGWGQSKRALWVVGAMLAAVLGCSALLPGLQDTWLMVGTLRPLLVLLGGAVILWYPRREAAVAALGQQQMMLLMSFAAVCSLVQYPFPYVTYFCYTAPLTLLAVVAIVSLGAGRGRRPLLAVLLVFFLGMGAFGMVAKHVYNPELRMARLRPLELPRAGGLLVDETAPYAELVPFLQQHSPNGMLYAGNDCPELYFLSSLRNPTRDDTGAPVAEVRAALEGGQVQLVVFNDASFFRSGDVPEELRAAVKRLLPQERSFGRFSVYWR